MAKTYTSVPNVATGDVYTASTYNTMTAQNINNLRVPPMVRVERTTTQSISTGTWTFISFSATAAHDTDGMWASGTPTYITIQTAGVYLVTASLGLDLGTTGSRVALIELNAATASTGTLIASNTSLANGVTDHYQSPSAVRSFAAGDKIYLTVYHTQGTSLNTRIAGTYLSATWQGQVS